MLRNACLSGTGEICGVSALQQAGIGQAAHLEVLIVAGVGGDEAVDLVYEVPQLEVGVTGRKLQLGDQPVHLQTSLC